MPRKKADKPRLGVGLDIGTMNLVSARQIGDETETVRMRDVFIDLPPNAKKMLKLNNTSFVDRGDELFVLGDAALAVANVFGSEPRRPLSAGLVAAGEIEALEVLGLLIKHVLGPPTKKGEHCYFSVPAPPVDDPTRDIVYHKAVFEKIVTECGYTGHSANEAMAIIYAEAAKDGFSGVAISFGSGMTNVAMSVSTIEALSFSVGRGGDWIDKGAATSVGVSQARICAIKEKGIDLLDPETREQEALSFYYKELIRNSLDQIAKRFAAQTGQFDLPDPIPLIVSGGTSMAGNFMTLFKQVFEEKKKRFPVPISEIRHASDPLNAVAKGMLVQASLEHEED